MTDECMMVGKFVGRSKKKSSGVPENPPDRFSTYPFDQNGIGIHLHILTVQ
jgi:hypothetical protein